MMYTTHVPTYHAMAKPVILFDLNGTLCYRDKVKKQVYLRPHFERLIDLDKTYTLGIYSSMMEHNVYHVMAAIETRCKTKLFDRDYIFTRKHTKRFSKRELKAFGLPSHKTKKSLAWVLPHVENVKIIDDELYKITAQDRDKAIILKSYTPDSTHDDELLALVNLLMCA